MHFSVLEVYWTKNQNSTKTFKKCETMSSTLSHLSESGKLSKKKKHHWQKQWLNSSKRYISLCMKHGGSVSATTRQQTYCASNFAQGGGEIPSPSVLRKAKLWNDSITRNCWRDPRDDPYLMHKPAEKLPCFNRDWHDTWCVCFICFSEKYFCKR